MICIRNVFVRIKIGSISVESELKSPKIQNVTSRLPVNFFTNALENQLNTFAVIGEFILRYLSSINDKLHRVSLRTYSSVSFIPFVNRPSLIESMIQTFSLKAIRHTSIPSFRSRISMNGN